MKGFFPMLLLMLFVVAMQVSAFNKGPTKQKHETQCIFIQSQTDDVILVSTAQPTALLLTAEGQGDVEKSSYSNLIPTGCNDGLTCSKFMMRNYPSERNSLQGLNNFKGRYRLDIGERVSRDRVTSRHI